LDLREKIAHPAGARDEQKPAYQRRADAQPTLGFADDECHLGRPTGGIEQITADRVQHFLTVGRPLKHPERHIARLVHPTRRCARSCVISEIR